MVTFNKTPNPIYISCLMQVGAVFARDQKTETYLSLEFKKGLLSVLSLIISSEG